MARAEFIRAGAAGKPAILFREALPGAVARARVVLPPGFLPGTAAIGTPAGPYPASALRRGAAVTTADGGVAVVRWVGRFRAVAAQVATVRVGGGVAVPEDLLLVVEDPALAPLCGTGRALVRAGDVGVGGDALPSAPAPGEYVCPVFERPVAFRLDGLAVASFVPDAEGLAALSPALRRELCRVMPELRYPAGQGAHWPLGPVLTRSDLARLR